MSVLDDPQIMNRLSVKMGLKISEPSPSPAMKISMKDLRVLAKKVLTDTVCDGLRSLYFPSSTYDEIRYQVSEMAARYYMGSPEGMDRRDGMRYLLMSGQINQAVGLLITRNPIQP